MKQALLCVSFGTSVRTARESIDAVENALHAAAPELDFFRAFTSPTIRRILADQEGEFVPSLSEALDRLCELGYQRVIVLPTHLLPGIEYDKIVDEVQAAKQRFEELRLGRPLLADEQDIRSLAEAISESYPARPEEALVLMGHGTAHSANEVYHRLQKHFRANGRSDIYVGTVEGTPTLSDVRAQLLSHSYRTVRLAPLLLVAGDHALNDMSSPAPTSWRSILESAGYQVFATLQGLGLLREIQQMYVSHLKELFI